jgi:hypothetical protein
MTNIKIVAIAALLSSAIASPVLAQDTTHRPTKTIHQKHYVNSYGRSVAHRNYNYDANASYDRNGNRFGPGDVTNGIVGGAVGTAGAFAAAPFAPFQNGYYANDGWGNDNGYNYDRYNGYYADPHGVGFNNGRLSPIYAERNNFACQPGTYFRGEDGLRHICQ